MSPRARAVAIALVGVLLFVAVCWLVPVSWVTGQ